MALQPDTSLVRTVATKVLPEHVASDPDTKQWFDREARSIAAPTHPYICTLYDPGGSRTMGENEPRKVELSDEQFVEYLVSTTVARLDDNIKRREEERAKRFGTVLTIVGIIGISTFAYLGRAYLNEGITARTGDLEQIAARVRAQTAVGGIQFEILKLRGEAADDGNPSALTGDARTEMERLLAFVEQSEEVHDDPFFHSVAAELVQALSGRGLNADEVVDLVDSLFAEHLLIGDTLALPAATCQALLDHYGERLVGNKLTTGRSETLVRHRRYETCSEALGLDGHVRLWRLLDEMAANSDERSTVSDSLFQEEGVGGAEAIRRLTALLGAIETIQDGYLSRDTAATLLAAQEEYPQLQADSRLLASVIGRREGELQISDEESGVLPSGIDEAHVWTLSASADASVVVDVLSTEFDAVLDVLTPDGVSVDRDDDSGDDTNPRLCVDVDAAEYLVAVTSYFGNGGEYLVRTSEIEGPCQ